MLDWMQELLDKFLSALMSVLPTSPFSSFINSLEQLPYLGYLNYFVPVGTFLKIGAAWLSAIALFYLYSIVMRWVRMIE
jgi:hypothetical protein